MCDPWRVPASGRPIDILELSEAPCSGLGICCTSMGLGQQMVKESDLKNLCREWLGEKITESPPDEESWGRGQWFKSRSGPKTHSLEVWLFHLQSVPAQTRHSWDGKERPKNKTHTCSSIRLQKQ